jgi:hypothetical protein
MQARELAMEANEDGAIRRILSTLDERLADLEREGRDRLRQARRLLRIGRPER